MPRRTTSPDGGTPLVNTEPQSNQTRPHSADSLPGSEVDITRVPELAPDEVARASHYKVDQAAPIARAADLVEYDAIIVGTGTRNASPTQPLCATANHPTLL